MRAALKIVATGLLLVLADARVLQPENDEQYELDAQEANQKAEQVVKTLIKEDPDKYSQASSETWQGPASPAQMALADVSGKLKFVVHRDRPDASSASAADAKTHASHAREAAKAAKQAAAVANKVAKHSVKVTHHAKKALKNALGALHDARVESSGLDKKQKHSLKKAEARLREATQTAKYGELEKVKQHDLQKERMQADLDKMKSAKGEKEELRRRIKELHKILKQTNSEGTELNKALDDIEVALDKSDGTNYDEIKADIERLREKIQQLENPDDTGKESHRRVATPSTPATAQEEATPIEEKGLDIDTQMPYGDLEPFGREDTAQELTESSIKESDQMVDQLERAEVAEEKRAVFRALTRLRGAAITSFDGVARSQTGNVDEYNKIHKWRKTHPLHHLADEESDVSKWAFPDNAD